MDCKNVPTMDIEGTTDLFIKVFINDNDKKSTDCHYRCMSGNGSFNYRVLMDMDYPASNTTLTLQAWDRDLFSSNEFIVEWNLDLKWLLECAYMERKNSHLNKKFYENFLKKKVKTDLEIEFFDEDTLILSTVLNDKKKINISLDIRCGPKEVLAKVGDGRSAPNFEPYLPPPVGRIKFSWNPLTMLLQLVSKEFLTKVCGLICVTLLIVGFICLIPIFFSEVMA